MVEPSTAPTWRPVRNQARSPVRTAAWITLLVLGLCVIVLGLLVGGAMFLFAAFIDSLPRSSSAPPGPSPMDIFRIYATYIVLVILALGIAYILCAIGICLRSIAAIVLVTLQFFGIVFLQLSLGSGYLNSGPVYLLTAAAFMLVLLATEALLVGALVEERRRRMLGRQ